MNETFNAAVGGVAVRILVANRTNFLSTMTVNISALQEAGITTVQCGNLGTSSKLRATSSGRKLCIDTDFVGPYCDCLRDISMGSQASACAACSHDEYNVNGPTIYMYEHIK